MQRIDDHRETFRVRRAEYDRIQGLLRKNRRFILIGSCLLCLLIGFMAGYIAAYPKQRVFVSVGVPSQPEAPSDDANTKTSTTTTNL